MKLRTQKLRGTEAAEIAEAALVMPVVFIFLLGIIWFGRAFNIYSTITQAAQQGAIVAARPVCATCSAASGGWPGNTNFPGDVTVAATVTSVLQASSLDPNQIIASSGNPIPGCSSSSSSNNILICRNMQLNSSITPPPSCTPTPSSFQICGTTVSFQYPFQFYLPFTSLNLTQVILNAEAQSRMEK